jgi:formate dehydrogenase subunit gamma
MERFCSCHSKRAQVEASQARRYEPYSEVEVARLIDEEKSQRGPLIPIFHRLQERFGYVDERALGPIAEALNISRAEVHGVLTFYGDFRRSASNATTIRICRAEACQSVGGVGLLAHAELALGIRCGEETSDGTVRLEQVFCLGNCALSPAVMVEDRLVGMVSPERFDAIVDAIRSTR